MTCNAKGCTNEATCAIGLNVPAMGCPIAEHDPIHLVLGLQVCDAHLADTRADEFFADNKLKEIVRVQARGRAEPDFKRAFVSRVELDSDEWKALTKSR